MEIEQNIKVAVDAIVFGYSDGQLKILLVKQAFGLMKGQWALVGGFVQNEETLSEAVKRELLEETGINVNYFEQLFTFGDRVNRDPRFRVISVAYFALVDSKKLKPIANSDAMDAEWFPINQAPKLAYDHEEILKLAYERLKSKLSYEPIGFDLLPKKFLFSDLENLYCTILEKEIDRRNFRKKILSFGIVEETDEYGPKRSGRPAKLYKFNKSKYERLRQKGFHFEIKFA